MTKVDPRLARYEEAYKILTDQVGYLGTAETAGDYAREFRRADDAMQHWLGCTNWATSRAGVFMVEAVRVLNWGDDGNNLAIHLLKLAITEIANETPRQPCPAARLPAWP